jgi:hypothetical protein
VHRYSPPRGFRTQSTKILIAKKFRTRANSFLSFQADLREPAYLLPGCSLVPVSPAKDVSGHYVPSLTHSCACLWASRAKHKVSTEGHRHASTQTQTHHIHTHTHRDTNTPTTHMQTHAYLTQKGSHPDISGSDFMSL